MDRNVVTLVGTQARNSAARAVRIAAEAIAVNSKVIDGKRQSRQSRSSKKAMVSVSSSHAGAPDYSANFSDSPVESENFSHQCIRSRKMPIAWWGLPARTLEGGGEGISEEMKRDGDRSRRHLKMEQFVVTDVGELGL